MLLCVRRISNFSFQTESELELTELKSQAFLRVGGRTGPAPGQKQARGGPSPEHTRSGGRCLRVKAQAA